MKPITIAIMSDLHIGENARSKDLCPENFETKGIDKDYKLKFINFLKDGNLKVNYLFIPGDISDKSRPDELKLASEFILDVINALKLKKENVLFVPGNHEVDWSIIRPKSEDTSGFYKSQRYAVLSNKEWIFSELLNCNSKYHCITPPHFTFWDYEDLFAVGYNSSWHDDPSISNHYGLVAQDDLDFLESYLKETNFSDDILKVFLVHHHPIQYSNPIPDEPDFSAMTNASNLLDLLNKYQFDLIVHGHKHKPYFRCESTNSGYPLVILGSGSFSSLLDSSWSGHVNNQFHLLKILFRDSESNCIAGLLENYTYLSGSGWKPSEKHNGIRHKEPFGHYVQPHVLKKNLRIKIDELFLNNSYLEWIKVIENCPEYTFLPPTLIMKIVYDLKDDLGYRLHGDDPETLILLK